MLSDMQHTDLKEIMETSPETMSAIHSYTNRPYDMTREEVKMLNELTKSHELAIISDTQGESMQLKTLNALQEMSLSTLNLGDAFEDIGSIQDIEISNRKNRKFADEVIDRTEKNRDGKKEI